MSNWSQTLLKYLPGGKDLTDLEQLRDITDDVSEQDFIPYAFHYNPTTLLTKNGELMHVIRITTNGDNADFESQDKDTPTIRDAIRLAISENVESERYAFWFHTIRKRVPINYNPQFPEPFAQEMHEWWNKAMRWQYSYTNEIYLSVLRQGKASELFDFNELRKGLLPEQNRKYREERLEVNHEKLIRTTDKILETLAPFSNAVRLGIEDRNGSLFSQPLEFLYYLVNMLPSEVPVSNRDISRQLAEHEVTFGYDAMESRSPEGKRRFAAILSLKGNPNLSPEVLDKSLQLPEELIISQSFNFIQKKQALEKKLEMLDLLKFSNDPVIAEISGLTESVSDGVFSNAKIDFGEQQTSITFIRDRYRSLDEGLGKLQDQFSKLGLITIREDLMLEDCFWGQLPGNFSFLRRKLPVRTSMAAGLARLNHFPSGKKASGTWGDPVAILPTTQDTPYFFHFSQGDSGHSIILDFNSFADERGAGLLNFLSASSLHYGGKVFVIDAHNRSELMVKSMGGNYYNLTVDERKKAPGMNPFQLEDNPRNRSFLSAWLMHFIHAARAKEEGIRDIIKGVVDQIYSMPANERTLINAIALVRSRDAELVNTNEKLLWTLFSSERDELNFDHSMTGIEMQQVTMTEYLTEPVFAYLLHRIITQLDGKPSVIVLNEAWELLNSKFFIERLASLMEMLSQKNTVILFSTRHFGDHYNSHLTKIILDNCTNQLFIPDDIPNNYYPEITGLTAHELSVLYKMERQKGHFLIKHGPETVECHMPLHKMGTFRRILSGDSKALRLIQIQNR